MMNNTKLITPPAAITMRQIRPIFFQSRLVINAMNPIAAKKRMKRRSFRINMSMSPIQVNCTIVV